MILIILISFLVTHPFPIADIGADRSWYADRRICHDSHSAEHSTSQNQVPYTNLSVLTPCYLYMYSVFCVYTCLKKIYIERDSQVVLH